MTGIQHHLFGGYKTRQCMLSFDYLSPYGNGIPCGVPLLVYKINHTLTKFHVIFSFLCVSTNDKTMWMNTFPFFELSKLTNRVESHLNKTRKKTVHLMNYPGLYVLSEHECYVASLEFNQYTAVVN